MPKLIILNGPCGVGKNTIASLYAEMFPQTVVVDIDALRRLIPNYRDNPVESGRKSYELAFAKCKALLDSNVDVVVPNLIRSASALDKFESIAKSARSEYYEFLLRLSKEAAIQRAIDRGFRPGSLLTLEKLDPMYQELTTTVASRPQTVVIDSSGDVESTFKNFIDHFNSKL